MRGDWGVFTMKICPKTKVSAKYEVKISNGVELPPPTYIKSRLVVAPFKKVMEANMWPLRDQNNKNYTIFEILYIYEKK